MNSSVQRLLLPLIFLPGLASPGQAADELRQWIDGPVRYLVAPAEVKLFKQLRRDEDRALFVERFWARRDPTPETLVNEYRRLLWERVREADERFVDGGRPGWMTDRGKIHILHGPPTQIEEALNLDSKGGPSAGRGLLRWIYEGRPGGRIELDPVVVVGFARGADGEYKLTRDPRLTSVFFDEVAVREGRYRAIDRFLELNGAPRRTELSVMLDLGRLQDIPPVGQVLLERVETIESYRTRAIDVRVARYRHPRQSGTLVVVTADVSFVDESVAPSVVARFRPRDATHRSDVLGEGSFKTDVIDGVRVAQARIVLEPDTYEVTVLVADPSTAETGLKRLTIPVAAAVPESALELSDVVIAREVISLPYKALVSYDEPFHVGPYRVVPRVNERLRAGEPLSIFFETYGGSSPFRLEYRLEGRDSDGSWLPLGEPWIVEAGGRSHAWELPTSDRWPLGEYRLGVEVRDSDGLVESHSQPFLLEAAGES